MSTQPVCAPGASRDVSRTRCAPRVWIVCTGAGRVQRGFEVYARDLFDHLREDGRIDVVLLKGAGNSAAGERVLRCIHRDARLNHVLCLIAGRSKRYVIEYASFCLSMLPMLLASPPQVIYALEAPVYKFLSAWRRRCGATYRLVHFTGGQLGSLPRDETAFLHHVTPCSLTAPGAAAFSSERQFVLPHFVDLRAIPAPANAAARAAARRRLALPQDRAVVLSVGNLDTSAKRMDYLVREVARVRPTPFVLLIGQRDPETPRLAALADSLLGSDGYRIATVPRDQLWDYYAASDAFALASLREGFGLVYLEALAAGLPVIAHDFDVARYVLGNEGFLTDLSRPGSLTDGLSRILRDDHSGAATRRRSYVQEGFDWAVLGPEYSRIFQEIADA